MYKTDSGLLDKRIEKAMRHITDHYAEPLTIRLNHAVDMLRSGEYNANETAHLCGFGDIFYFSKVYKESRGVSPSNAYKAE